MTLDPIVVRRAFARAAAAYDATAVLQHEVEARLLERVDELGLAPARVLDLGAGTGGGTASLRKRFGGAQVVALDQATDMLREAGRRRGWWKPFQRVAGDANALPLRDGSVDFVFSNLCLQWCPDLPRVFAELRRVLVPGGAVLFTTFGPMTLHELRAAWGAADGAPHVNRFADLPEIGDALLAAGFRDPVVDLDTITLTYRDARTLMRELRAIGAGNADSARPRGLTGRARLARVLAAYEGHRRDDGTLPATYEVIYARAIAPGPGQPRRQGGAEIAAIPVDLLRGSRVKR
ncbi:MAG TPA: malonyl-ACP O-methyltransferase BioC [Xanthomonadales bacterium]|nr:malonyl-ACP O-methyltransferase BioC [Xanthomonadales bacterium]